MSACFHFCSQASVLGLAVFVCGVPAFTFMAIKRSADKNKLDDPRCVCCGGAPPSPCHYS